MLTLYTAQPGLPGTQLFVAEADWHRFGRSQYLPAGDYPDVRALCEPVPPPPVA